MNIYDQRKKAQRTLDRLEKERAEKLPKLRQELSNAKVRGVKGEGLKRYEQELELHEGLSDQAIASARDELSDIQQQVNSADLQLQRDARAELAGKKEKAQATWLQSGGTQQGFEDAWPGMVTDLLTQRILEALKG